MDLFLKFLILGGKYLSQLTAQSIVEAYRRSIQLSRSLNHHCSQSMSVVTNYDNVLELYNRNLEDLQVNPNSHLAFISDHHRQEFVSYMKEVQLLTDEAVNDLLSEPPCIEIAGTVSDDKVSYVRQMALSIINASKNTAVSPPALAPLVDACQCGNYQSVKECCVESLLEETMAPAPVSNIKTSTDFAKTENMKAFRGRPSRPINFYCEKATEFDEKSTVINHVAEFLDRHSEYIKCANDTFKQLQLDISFKYQQMRQQQLQKFEQEDQREIDFANKLKAVQTEVEHCTKLMKCVQGHFDVHEEDMKTKRLFTSVDKIIKDVEEITVLMNTNDSHFNEFESFQNIKKKGIPCDEMSKLMDVNLSAYNKLLCSMVTQQLSINQRYSTAASTSTMIPIDGFINGFLSKFHNNETAKIIDVNQKAFEDHEQKIKYPLIGRWNNRMKRSRKRTVKEKVKHRFNKQKQHGSLKKNYKGFKTHAVRRTHFMELPLHRTSEDLVSPNYAALSSSWIKDEDHTSGNWEELAEDSEKKANKPMINIQSAIERFLPKKQQAASKGQQRTTLHRSRKCHNIVLVDEKLDNLVEQLMSEMNDDNTRSAGSRNFSASPPPVSCPSKAQLISDIKKDIKKKVQDIRNTTTSEVEDPMAYHLVPLKETSTADYEDQEGSEIFFQSSASPVVEPTYVNPRNQKAEEFDDDYAKILAELTEPEAFSIDGEKVCSAKRVRSGSIGRKFDSSYGQTESIPSHHCPHTSGVRLDSSEVGEVTMIDIVKRENAKLAMKKLENVKPKKKLGGENIESSLMPPKLDASKLSYRKQESSNSEADTIRKTCKAKTEAARSLHAKMDILRKETVRKDAARTARSPVAFESEKARSETAKFEIAKAEAIKTAKAKDSKTEAARVEAAKSLAAKAEAAHVEAAKLETAKAEAAKSKASKIAAARIEAARIESEKAEAARMEAKKKEIAHYEAMRKEAGKVQAAKVEADKIEARKKEMAKIEVARIEAIRSEVGMIEARKSEAAAKREAARLESAKIEEATAKMEAAKAEAARMEAAKKEKMRIEAEKLEAARVEAAKIDAAKLEAKRIEQVKIEAARLEAARVEAARLEAKQREIERIEAAKFEAAKIQAAKLETAKLEAAKFEATKMDSKRLENANIDAAKAEAARIKARKSECAKIEAARMKAVKKQVARSEAFKMATKKVDVTKIEAAKKEAAKAMAARAEAARLAMIKAEKEKVEAARNEAKKLEIAKMKIARMEAAKAMSAMAEAARMEARQKEISKIEAAKAEAARVAAARIEETRSHTAMRFEAEDEDVENIANMNDDMQEESSDLDVPILKTTSKPVSIKFDHNKLSKPSEIERQLFTTRNERTFSYTNEDNFDLIEDDVKEDKVKEQRIEDVQNNSFGNVLQRVDFNRQSAKNETTRCPNKIDFSKGQVFKLKSNMQSARLPYFKQPEFGTKEKIKTPVKAEAFKSEFAKPIFPKLSVANVQTIKFNSDRSKPEKLDFIQEATTKLAATSVENVKVKMINREPLHMQKIKEDMREDEVTRICSEIKFEHTNNLSLHSPIDMMAGTRRSSSNDDKHNTIDVHNLMNEINTEMSEKQIFHAWEENNKLLELAREMNIRAAQLKRSPNEDNSTVDMYKLSAIPTSEEVTDRKNSESTTSVFTSEQPELQQNKEPEELQVLAQVKDDDTISENIQEENKDALFMKLAESKSNSDIQWIENFVEKQEDNMDNVSAKLTRHPKRKPKHDDEQKFFRRWNLAKNLNPRRRKLSKSNTVVRTNSSEITLVDMINGGTRLLESSKASTRQLSFSKASINYDLLKKPEDQMEIEGTRRNKSKDIKLIPIKLLQKAVKGKEVNKTKETNMKYKHTEQGKETLEMNKYRAASAKRLKKPSSYEEESDIIEDKEKVKASLMKASEPFSSAAMNLEKIVGASSNKIIARKVQKNEITTPTQFPNGYLSKIDEQHETTKSINSIPTQAREQQKPKKDEHSAKAPKSQEFAFAEMANALREESNKVDSEEPTQKGASSVKVTNDEPVEAVNKINVNKLIEEESKNKEPNDFVENTDLDQDYGNLRNQEEQSNESIQLDQVDKKPDVVKMSAEEEALLEKENMDTYHQVYENLKELCAKNMPVQKVSSKISESSLNETLKIKSVEDDEPVVNTGLKVIKDTDNYVQSIQLNERKLDEIKSKKIAEKNNSGSLKLRSEDSIQKESANEESASIDSANSEEYELNLVQIMPNQVEDAQDQKKVYAIKDDRTDLKIKMPLPPPKIQKKCNLYCKIKYDDPMLPTPGVKTIDKHLRESIEYYHMFNTEECIKRGHMANKILIEYDQENEAPQEQFFVKPRSSSKQQTEYDNVSTNSVEADETDQVSGYKSEKSMRLSDESKTRKSDQGMLPQKHLESDSIRGNKRGPVNAFQTRKQSSVCDPQHDNALESKSRAFIKDFKAKVKAFSTGTNAEIENSSISVQNEPTVSVKPVVANETDTTDPKTETCKVESTNVKDTTDSKRYQVSINFDIIDQDIQIKENTLNEQPPVREAQSINIPTEVSCPKVILSSISEIELVHNSDAHKEQQSDAQKPKVLAENTDETKLPKLELHCTQIESDTQEPIDIATKLENTTSDVIVKCKADIISKPELRETQANKPVSEVLVDSKSCKETKIEEVIESLVPLESEKFSNDIQDSISVPDIIAPIQHVIKVEEETKDSENTSLRTPFHETIKEFKKKIMAVNNKTAPVVDTITPVVQPVINSKVLEPLSKAKISADPFKSTVYTDIRKRLALADVRRPTKFQYQRIQNDDFKSSGKSVRDLNKLSSIKLASGPPKYRFNLKPTKKTGENISSEKQNEVTHPEGNQSKGDSVKLESSSEVTQETIVDMKQEPTEDKVHTSGTEMKTESMEETKTETETPIRDTKSVNLPDSDNLANVPNRPENISGSRGNIRFGNRLDNAPGFRTAKQETRVASQTTSRPDSQQVDNATSIRLGSRVPFQAASKTNISKIKAFGRQPENKTAFRPQSKSENRYPIRPASRFETKSVNRSANRAEFRSDTAPEIKIEVPPEAQAAAALVSLNSESVITDEAVAPNSTVKCDLEDVSIVVVPNNAAGLIPHNLSEAADQDKSTSSYANPNTKSLVFADKDADKESKQSCESYETQIEFQRQSYVRNIESQRPQYESFKSFDYSFQKGEGLRNKPPSYPRCIENEFAKVVKASKLPRSVDVAKSATNANESIEQQTNAAATPRASIDSESVMPTITANMVNPIQTNIVDMTSITCVQYLNKLSYNIDNSAYSSLIEIFKDPIKTGMPTKPDSSRLAQVFPTSTSVTPVNKKTQETFFVNGPPVSKAGGKKVDLKQKDLKTGQEVFIYVDSVQNASQPLVKTLSKSVLFNLRQKAKTSKQTTSNSLKKSDSTGSLREVSSIKRLPDFVPSKSIDRNERNMKRLMMMDEKMKKRESKGGKNASKNVGVPLDKTLEHVLDDFYAKRSSKYPESSFRPITTPAFSDKSRTVGTHYRKSYSNINSSDSNSTNKVAIKEVLEAATPVKSVKSENSLKIQGVEELKSSDLEKIQHGNVKKSVLQRLEASKPNTKKIELMPTRSETVPSQISELKLPHARRKNNLPNIPEIKNAQIVIPKKEVMPSTGEKPAAKRKVDKENKVRQSTVLNNTSKISVMSKKLEAHKALGSKPAGQNQKPVFNKTSNLLKHESAASSSDPKASIFLKTLQNKVKQHIHEHLVKKRQEKDREKKLLPRCDIRPYTNDFGKQLARLKAKSEREKESLHDKDEYQRQLAQHLQELSALPKVKEKKPERFSTVVYKPPTERGIREVTKPSLSDMKKTIMKHLRITSAPSRSYLNRHGGTATEHYLLRHMSSSSKVQKRKHVFSYILKAVSSESGNEQNGE